MFILSNLIVGTLEFVRKGLGLLHKLWNHWYECVKLISHLDAGLGIHHWGRECWTLLYVSGMSGWAIKCAWELRLCYITTRTLIKNHIIRLFWGSWRVFMCMKYNIIIRFRFNKTDIPRIIWLLTKYIIWRVSLKLIFWINLMTHFLSHNSHDPLQCFIIIIRLLLCCLLKWLICCMSKHIRLCETLWLNIRSN